MSPNTMSASRWAWSYSREIDQQAVHKQFFGEQNSVSPNTMSASRWAWSYSREIDQQAVHKQFFGEQNSCLSQHNVSW